MNDFAAPLVGIGAALFFGVPLLQTIYRGVRGMVDKSSNNTDSRRRAGGVGSEGPVLDPTKALKGLRMLLCPVVSAAATWFVHMNKEKVLSVVPALFSNYAGAALVKVLPLHPKDLMDAFNFGRLVEQARVNAAPVAEILANASRIAGRNVTSLTELLAVEGEIDRMVHGKSIVGRILGAFTLVNIIWGISILGIAAFISPFAFLIARPIVVKLAEAVTWTFQNVIVPVAKALIPLYEPLAYCVAMLFHIEALRYPVDYYSTTGMMLAFSGLTAQFMCWLYSVYRHSTKSGDVEMFAFVTATYVFANAAPAAIAHHSSFLGYVTIASLVTAFGFTMFSTRWCLFLGFENRQVAKRSAFACLSMNLTHVIIRVFDLIPRSQMEPFESAINVMCTTVYFLALMCASINDSIGFAILYGGSMLAYLILGELLDMPGMSNTAKVYIGLWVSIFVCSNPPRKNDARVFWFMALFVALYFVSLFLSRNPIYMATLFNPAAAWAPRVAAA